MVHLDLQQVVQLSQIKSVPNSFTTKLACMIQERQTVQFAIPAMVFYAEPVSRLDMEKVNSIICCSRLLCLSFQCRKKADRSNLWFLLAEMEEVRENKEWMCPHCVEAKGLNPFWICNRYCRIANLFEGMFIVTLDETKQVCVLFCFSEVRCA